MTHGIRRSRLLAGIVCLAAWCAPPLAKAAPAITKEVPTGPARLATIEKAFTVTYAPAASDLMTIAPDDGTTEIPKTPTTERPAVLPVAATGLVAKEGGAALRAAELAGKVHSNYGISSPPALALGVASSMSPYGSYIDTGPSAKADTLIVSADSSLNKKGSNPGAA